MHEAVARRVREREELISRAGVYAEALAERVQPQAVVGSVARGDFNVWSDIDVVVVAPELPERAPDRGMVLIADAPAGVQPVGFTREEFAAALAKGNPLVREAVEVGVVVAGTLPRAVTDADP